MSDRGALSGLPSAEPELYVDADQLADLMGVSRSTVERMTRSGMPSVTWGRRTRRYRPSVALQWAREQQRAGVADSAG